MALQYNVTEAQKEYSRMAKEYSWADKSVPAHSAMLNILQAGVTEMIEMPGNVNPITRGLKPGDKVIYKPQTQYIAESEPAKKVSEEHGHLTIEFISISNAKTKVKFYEDWGEYNILLFEKVEI